MKSRCCAILFLAGICLFPMSRFARDLLAQNSKVFIADIQFKGNQNIPAFQLKNLLGRSKLGSIYIKENLDMALQRLKDAYVDEGYLHVEVGSPDVQIKGLGEQKGVLITIPIEEGPLYRVKDMSVTNTHVLPSETIMQLCPLKKGAPYSPNKAAHWRLAIEETYRSLGHIRSRCEIREEIDEDGKTVKGLMECEEGQAYIIGKIALVGDESLDVSQLKRRLLLREGGVFNPEMLAMSIQYLNRTGEYGTISHSDVQTVINDDDRTVDLTFHLNLIED